MRGYIFAIMLGLIVLAGAGCSGDRAGTFKGLDRPKPPPAEKK